MGSASAEEAEHGMDWNCRSAECGSPRLMGVMGGDEGSRRTIR